MYMRRFVLTFLILLFTCGMQPVRGAAPRFLNYTSADGLSSNTVLSMLQDRDGLIWIGTTNGLYIQGLQTVRWFIGQPDQRFGDG